VTPERRQRGRQAPTPLCPDRYVDATVIRALLVPALMKLFGQAN
jgi:uncharacterized membrane protein YdfJ with MMPL/SSD domain